MEKNSVHLYIKNIQWVFIYTYVIPIHFFINVSTYQYIYSVGITTIDRYAIPKQFIIYLHSNFSSQTHTRYIIYSKCVIPERTYETHALLSICCMYVQMPKIIIMAKVCKGEYEIMLNFQIS